MTDGITTSVPAEIPAEAKEFYITGGPGCGKTTTLSRYVAKAVADGRNPLVLSLTRNAAAAAAGRSPNLPSSRVGTMHSFCYRALGGPRLADTPEGIRDWNISHPDSMLSESRDRDEFDESLNQGSVTCADPLMAEYQRLRATMQPIPDQDPLAAFAREWTGWCSVTNTIDSNGLIELCIRENVPPPGSPGVIFVDEAQDLTPLELKLLRQWSASGIPLVLAGDPNQNLYRWRGTDSRALADLEFVAPEYRQALTQSLRVPRAIYDTALAWMAECPTKPVVDYRPRDTTGEVRRIPAIWYRPDQVIALAEAQAAQGQKVMILASSAYFLVPTIANLVRAAVPFHNPWRSTNIWNLDAPDGDGVRASDRIRAYTGFDPASPDALARAIEWTAMLEPRAAFADDRSGLAQLQRISLDIDPPSRARWISSILTPQAFNAAAASNLNWLADHLAEDCRPQVRYMVNVAIRNGVPILDHDPNIIIGTIHSVKGAESDAVYLFPDLALPDMWDWLGSADMQASIHRQFYVAMTRSRTSLTLCAPAGVMYVDL